MRLANDAGRAVVMTNGGPVDVSAASDGRFGPAPDDVLAKWDAFAEWVADALPTKDAPMVDVRNLGPVVTCPRQVFAVGLNYRAHALESGLSVPEVPLVFTKFVSSVAAPTGVLLLPTGKVDWEVEVAVVMGREARHVSRDEAWAHVAGITAAQDYSARDVQLAGASAPQFSLGKSFAGFTPLGPMLVTPDEFADRDAISLECRVNGEVVQSSTTADLIFPVDVLVSYLSHIVTLYPGDVILTGTPSGVGLGMSPPRYLVPGDRVVTVVDGVGALEQVCEATTRFEPALLLA